ncbi:MAG: succinate dehydrogenase cytochrome b subunit [Weeksellaceae bacterium]|nr:succinate dehydrogenase cytochrome b subunit [Weeksellaceae bacterium]
MAQGLFQSSIGRKFAMALSAFFLLIFLLQHLLVNFLSVISPEMFNAVSHFMGLNPLVQFALQPILLAGIIFHFVLGFVLEIRNQRARGPVKYVRKNRSQNSTWMSRNMLLTGAVILAFLGLHLYDFWWPEISHKYVHFDAPDAHRYYGELVQKFTNPIRVGIYILAFVLLALHLMHGFQSAFQSMGANHRRYNGFVKTLGTLYSIVIPLGFIIIAVYHYINA